MLAHIVCHKDTNGFAIPCIDSRGQLLAFSELSKAETALAEHRAWLRDGLEGVVQTIKVAKTHWFAPSTEQKLIKRWHGPVAAHRSCELKTLFIKTGKIAV